jgi:hypothetical protein
VRGINNRHDFTTKISHESYRHSIIPYFPAHRVVVPETNKETTSILYMPADAPTSPSVSHEGIPACSTVLVYQAQQSSSKIQGPRAIRESLSTMVDVACLRGSSALDRCNAPN